MSYCTLWINLWYVLYMKLPFGRDPVSYDVHIASCLSPYRWRILLRIGSLLFSLITKISLFIHTIKHKQLLPEITISNSNVRCINDVIWKPRYQNNNSFFADENLFWGVGGTEVLHTVFTTVHGLPLSSARWFQCTTSYIIFVISFLILSYPLRLIFQVACPLTLAHRHSMRISLLLRAYHHTK